MSLSVKDFRFAPLEREFLAENIPIFALLSKSLSDDYWEATHYLMELPSKWELSRVVFNNQRIAAFMIASDQGNSLHVHRLVVANEWHGMGLGKALIFTLSGAALRMAKSAITLKVLQSNLDAIKFYEKLEFRPNESQQNGYLLFQLTLKNQ